METDVARYFENKEERSGDGREGGRGINPDGTLTETRTVHEPDSIAIITDRGIIKLSK